MPYVIPAISAIFTGGGAAAGAGAAAGGAAAGATAAGVSATTIAAVATTTAAVAGAAVSYYGAQQAARSQQSIADYNARVQAQNARLQYSIQQAEGTLNRRMIEATARQQANNAIMLRQQAGAVAARGREEVRRRREEMLRFSATQKARIAKSGVVAAGSPLEMLAETAGIMALELHDIQFSADQERRNYLRAADLEIAARGRTLFQGDVENLKLTAARSGLLNNLRGAEFTRMEGAARAGALRTTATANLFSNLASTAGDAYQLNRAGAYSAG